jgi:MarR family transcriptional regulator, organic hydroperoxide resistance regulator
MQQTLGTQLRHLLELLDGAVQRSYAQMGLAYRPRYTPVMRSLIEREPLTLGEVARDAGISQPAATQTVALMIEDDIIETAPSDDGRQKLLRLSDKGRAMAEDLERGWAATAGAADSLDRELLTPLTGVVAEAIKALEARSFDERIREAKAASSTGRKPK